MFPTHDFHFSSLDEPNRIVTIKSELVLNGAFGITWPVGKPLNATCQRSLENAIFNPSMKHQTVPDVRCTCGIYALKEPDHRAVNLPHGELQRVLGIVEIWGKIIRAEHGYRAQTGQLRAVVKAPSLVALVYGVQNLPSVRYARREFMMNEEVSDDVVRRY
jgi:hypothetical protein